MSVPPHAPAPATPGQPPYAAQGPTTAGQPPYAPQGQPGQPSYTPPGQPAPQDPAGQPPDAARRPRFGFGLLGPRRDRHTVPADQLAALSLPMGDDGVVIGADQRNQPVVLGLNRPTPFDVVLVGGLWTAQVIALRTAGTGARVAVETGRAQVWGALVQAAGGGHPCMITHEVGRVSPQGASVRSPVLVVRDCGMQPPRGRVAAAPWQSVLTLLPYLSPVAPRLLEHAGLVGIQRVSPDEAEEIGRVMALPRADVAALSTLPDWVTLWCTRNARQYVTLQATDAESGLLGAPRRVD